MYAQIEPSQVELSPQGSATLTVHVSNAGSTIDAYEVNVFGLDPSWVSVTPRRLSLFPSESESVALTITLPQSFPSGHRMLSIHVQSENDPTEFTLLQAGMYVAEQPRLQLRIDPAVVTGGTSAGFGMVITNEGNNTVIATPSAIDPEELATITFTPAIVELNPGQREVIQAVVEAKRPWFGQPKIRTFTFVAESTTKSEMMATFIQKARIGRLLFSVLGLLTAAAVFYVVLSQSFNKVVDKTSLDKSSLAAALEQGGDGSTRTPVHPPVISGTVAAFSTGAHLPGVQADLFAADDTKVPIATEASNNDGVFAFGNVGAGKYKLRLKGAGFAEMWYPDQATAADAKEITTEFNKPVEPLAEVKLGGLPGMVAGSVIADNPIGATATLLVPGAIKEEDAKVQTVKVAADGSFLFAKVQSPATYELVIEQAGFALETRTVRVDPGQSVEGIEMVLRRAGGVISGTVFGSGLPLGGVTVEATDGTAIVSTVTLTTDAGKGTYSLRGLATPAVYTITVSKAGFTSETRTVELKPEAESPPIDVQLQLATGSIGGTATFADGTPAGGITVAIVGGDTTISTTTISSSPADPLQLGTFLAHDLPIPATYTVTFTKTGYGSQVLLVNLDPATGLSDKLDLFVSLDRNVGTVQGQVLGADGRPAAHATVTLNDGTTARTLITADDLTVGTARTGDIPPVWNFEFSNVAFGTYTLTASLTGTTDVVSLVNVTDGATQHVPDIRLAAQASLVGSVTLLDSAGAFQPMPDATVRLYLATKFPGSFADAAATTVTDKDGLYSFTSLDAPQDFVIAVFPNDNSPDPLDSRLVLTEPSKQVTVSVFQILSASVF